jgi:hypothetical protein
MKELTISARNEVGALAAVSEALGGVGVNIEAISCYGEGNKAIFRVLTADSATAMKTLSRLPNLEIKESDTIVIKMINRPGELGKLTRKLSNQGINLESLYIVTRKDDYTEVALKPAESDLSKAKEVLGVK